MTTISVELSDDVRLFAENFAKQRGFATVNDFISALVSEAKDQQARVESDLLEGLESGPATKKSAEDWDQLRARIASRGVS